MKFIINNIFLISILLITAFMLFLPTLQRRGKHIPPFLVTKKMNEGKVVILDVSKTTEYAEGHVRGAIHIPIEELSDKMARIERYKDATVVIVCPNGSRAAKATSSLRKAGFKDVSSMEGGMKDWKSQNMPVVKDEVEETQSLPDRLKKKKGKSKGKS